MRRGNSRRNGPPVAGGQTVGAPSASCESQPIDYLNIVDRFRSRVRRALAPGATVAVVSKGDRELLEIDGRRAWHFPQRADGVYAGYYPPDSVTAIAHLEALREKGAEFLALPSPAMWWLDHYPEFAGYLESQYRLLVRDEEVCLIYALVEPGARQNAEANGSSPADSDAPGAGTLETSAAPAGGSPAVDRSPPLGELVRDEMLHDLRRVFDVNHYGGQAGVAFESTDDAIHHYLVSGYRAGLDPHPLFSGAWYAARYPEVRLGLANPLVHFLEHSVLEMQDPSPYFDTEYYYAQGSDLREKRVNALVHYINNAPSGASYHPNPLFRDGYYLRTYPDAQDGASPPLAHYLLHGSREGRFVSHVHEDMSRRLGALSRGLLRGNWKRATVLFFAHGDPAATGSTIEEVSQFVASEYHLESVVIAYRRGDAVDAVGRDAGLVVLDDYAIACDILRPSALRLLTKTLTSLRPIFAISEIPEVLEGLRLSGIGAYFVLPEQSRDDSPSSSDVFDYSKRVLVPSSAAFQRVSEEIGRRPTNVMLWRGVDRAVPAGSPVRELLDSAARDFDLDPVLVGPARPRRKQSTRKVLVACSDWNVSGVNASLEAVGKELRGLGWDIEILFTRDESAVLESSGGEAHLPQLPYRFLHRRRRGVQGMWEALIAELEAEAPCILFMGYDFLGNSVAPALTDGVGVVAWVQADDGDYYEQVYRLGRYCNAVVCVSDCIRKKVDALHPLIGSRARVIHNSSVRQEEVVESRSAAVSKTLRIVYTGRLVQYQKRVLDYVELARALDRMDVPYTISLIGTFSAHDNTEETFERRAGEHLEDGRIRLLGRMPRDRILDELTGQDVFVLLSDFEGLPLALVEAMARGCVPVVAATGSGIPELLKDGHNGLIVSGRDYDDWARLITDLWRDRRRFSLMSKRARGTVRSQFTVERAAERFDELFRRVADEIAAGNYERPPSLNWGEERSPTGDVLPPPSLLRPAAVQISGLR
jgi:glycosyltransferase involved in cell wall biosynthesis